MGERRKVRERWARGIGVAVALAVAAAGVAAIGWPAPGIAAALGLAAYLSVRPRRE